MHVVLPLKNLFVILEKCLAYYKRKFSGQDSVSCDMSLTKPGEIINVERVIKLFFMTGPQCQPTFSDIWATSHNMTARGSL